jgi:hypothetical protein
VGIVVVSLVYGAPPGNLTWEFWAFASLHRGAFFRLDGVMASNKKPRRAYRPRPMIVDPFAAFRPVDAARASAHMLVFFQALDAMKLAEQPDERHWRVLADVINLCETLVLQGKLSREVDPLLEAANKAMAECGHRFRDGKAMRLSGEGMQVVASVVEVYGECMKLLTEREMDLCRRATEGRLHRIRTSGGQPGQDVVIV